jgi:hypothetical protein
MSNVSEASVIDLFYSAVALSDSILQFWISITFAVIVATHFVGKRIGSTMYLLMASLYGLVSIVSIARYLGASVQLIHYVDALREAGEWPVPGIYSVIAGYGTLLLLGLGTVGTLYFMRSVRRSASREGA